MPLLEQCGYRVKPLNLVLAVSGLAFTFALARIVISDSLTLGYAMAIPAYVFLAFVLDNARIGKGRFRAQVWAETLIAMAAAVGSGYLGYRLWLSGY